MLACAPEPDPPDTFKATALRLCTLLEPLIRIDAEAPEPDLDDLLWTIACARIILGGAANIQAPPNLSPGTYPRLIAAGINDWGGISPVTPDHVNPEAPWPAIATLADKTASMETTTMSSMIVKPFCFFIFVLTNNRRRLVKLWLPLLRP